MPLNKRKLTLTSTPKIRTHLDQLTAANAPFVSRHRVLRVAVILGLGAMLKNPDLLRQALLNEQREAA